MMPTETMIEAITREILDEVGLHRWVVTNVLPDYQSDRKYVHIRKADNQEFAIDFLPDASGSAERLKQVIKEALIQREPSIQDLAVMQNGQRYLATYSGSDGIAWREGHSYHFQAESDSEAQTVNRDELEVLGAVMFPSTDG